MNRNTIWCAIYVAALIAIAFVLTRPPEAPTTKAKPAADTCLAPDGWSAAIEPADGGDWACVMRKGGKTKAFFY